VHTLWWAWTRRDALTSIDVDAQDVIYTRILERLSDAGWPGAYVRTDDLLRKGMITPNQYRNLMGAEGEEADPPAHVLKENPFPPPPMGWVPEGAVREIEPGKVYHVCGGCHSVQMCVRGGKCMLNQMQGRVPGANQTGAA
jgi:hypothetical protein